MAAPSKSDKHDILPVVIAWVFSMLLILMGGLFFLEAVVLLTKKQSKGYMTPEIMHTIFGLVGGWSSAIVAYLVKNIADNMRAEDPGKDNDKTTET